MDPSDEWIDDLKLALEAQVDFSTLRNIARNRPFPSECRAQAWLILLGVAHKPDAFLDFDELYDLPEQTSIRFHCQQIVDKLGHDNGTDKLAVTSDLESILTLYCKQRLDTEKILESISPEPEPDNDDPTNSAEDGVNNKTKTKNIFEPDNGWTDVLQLLAALNLSRHHLYNVFYAVTTKYIPRGCVPNGRPFDLFRLLLLYHDPQLCSFLDTRKLTPDLYANSWFNSLFASTTSLDVALAMWDVYLQQADPFLVFFMALVILMNAKEQILSMSSEPKESIVEIIRQFPSQLAAADIEDFCQLASYYSTRTPQSFRRDYHGPLYGSHFMSDGFENVTVHTLLCLPVSIQELLKSSASSSSLSSPAKTNKRNVTSEEDDIDIDDEDDLVRYFVIDGRPSKQYNNGHMPGAFSIDASLIVNDPAQFQSLAKTLEEIKSRTQSQSHWCLMGSGREEEDKYIHMVASYLLQRNTPYVSIARGGYQALHENLKEKLATRLKSHSVKGCLVCCEMGKAAFSPPTSAANSTTTNQNNTRQQSSPGSKKGELTSDTSTSSSLGGKSWAIFSRMKDAVKNKSAVLVAAAGAAATNESRHHINSHERNQTGKKPYRNLANVFSISDDLSDDEDEFDNSNDAGGGENNDRASSTPNKTTKIRLKEWLKRAEIVDTFECQEIEQGAEVIVHPSYLALTKTHLYVLREDPDQPDYGYVKSRRDLSSIQRITSKRQHPEVLTFKYGVEVAPDRQKITGAERFWVPKAGECAKAVKCVIVAMQEEATAQLASSSPPPPAELPQSNGNSPPHGGDDADGNGEGKI